MEITPSRVQKPLFVFLGCIILVFGTWYGTTAYYNSQFHVFYSLDQKRNDKEIVTLIDSAHQYVYFAIYFFNKDSIADALIRAKQRGLIVWGIIDRDSSTGPDKDIVARLQAAGITIETQKHQDGIMHMKTIVTDTGYASGSYNWTGSATYQNDEVLEVSSNTAMHDKYFLIVKQLLLTNQ